MRLIGLFCLILLLAIESACIPIPSEIIMPFSDFLVFKGALLLWGALGSVVGSWLAYAIGAWGGRPLAERYGKYVLIPPRDLDRAERWFQRYGEYHHFYRSVAPDNSDFHCLVRRYSPDAVLAFQSLHLSGFLDLVLEARLDWFEAG